MNNLNDKIEITILNNLLFNEAYLRKVLPYLKEEYFSDSNLKQIFKEINNFVDLYNSLPTKEAILIALSDTNKFLSEDDYKKTAEIINNFSNEVPAQIEWLLIETEKFCKNSAILKALEQSIQIFKGEDKKLEIGSVPQILTEAIGVSFDTRIGHSYIEDAEKRFDYYQKKEERIEFDLTYFNKITGGGVPKKTMNMIIGGVGTGKSLALAHIAASYLEMGKNVVYFTLEMSEEETAKRIDANLLDVNINDLPNLTREKYIRKIGEIQSKSNGKLIIKEYPTSSASVNHFRHFLNELRIKKDFIPDAVFVDYLNIAGSAKIKMGHNINSYTLIKSVAEELRALAVEYQVPLWSAAQVNRSGYTDSDFGLQNVSESFGIAATADFALGIITTEELEKLGQLLVKQLKNRYNEASNPKRFVIGIDKPKMRLYDLNEEAQKILFEADNIDKDTPAFDKTGFGNSMKAETNRGPKNIDTEEWNF